MLLSTLLPKANQRAPGSQQQTQTITMDIVEDKSVEEEETGASVVSNDTDLEIFGLHNGGNGRNCSVHTECGRCVQRGDVFRLVRCIVVVAGRSETAVKAVKVIDGVDTCTVGFVPRVFVDFPKVVNHLDKFVQVIELYHDSCNSYKASLSKRNSGFCSVAFLDEMHRNE